MNNSNYKLAQSVRTTTEAKQLIRKLDQVINNEHNTGSHHISISKILTTTERQLLLEDLKNKDITLTESNALSAISDIREAIKKMPVATVELAWHPSALFTEEIADSINTLAKTPCTLEMKYNTAIGGGLIIYFQGRQYDYSLSKKFDDLSKV